MYKTFPFPGFGGGLNLRDGVDVVEENQALDALNVLFMTRGTVEERSGYAQLTIQEGANRYDSLTPFYKSDGTRQIVAGAGARLEGINTAGTVIASLATGITASPHFFRRFGGPTGEHLYISNGTDTVRRWDGAAFSTPTYVGTTPTGKFLGLSVTDNRLVNARFTGTTAGNNPSTVRFSDEGDPLSWDVTNYIDLTPGDGEAIMGVATWRDLTIVFKQSRFFVFYGNSVDDDGAPEFNYRPVDAGVGLVSPQALAVSEQGVYFLDRTGIYFTSGSQPERVSDAVRPIFHGDPSVYYTGGTLNDSAIGQTTMAYHDERLWLSFPSGVSAVNDKQLVFDPHEKWWTLYDLPAGPMINFRPADADELVFGYATGTKHLGRHVQGTYTADAMGETFINLVANPSGEAGVPTVQSSSGSSAGQPAATVVDTTLWSKVGTHASRYTVTRDDGAALAIRTATGTGGIPVTPGHFMAIRVSMHLDSTTGSVPLDNWKGRLQFYKSDGTSSAIASVIDGLISFSPPVGATQDFYVIGQVPSDGAFVSVVGFVDMPSGIVTAVIDLDAFMLVDLGTDFTGPVAASTLAADVPAYFDGSVGGTWLGAANASQSLLFLPAVGGKAINAFWQSGWFNYGTNAVKDIRESKIAGSGLVNIEFFRDYRQTASRSVQKELSPPVGFWNTGLLWDSGIMWGPSGGIQPKAVRKAVRGENFSIRFSNNVINRTFRVHRFVTHVREVRVPSVVKVR